MAGWEDTYAPDIGTAVSDQLKGASQVVEGAIGKLGPLLGDTGYNKYDVQPGAPMEVLLGRGAGNPTADVKGSAPVPASSAPGASPTTTPVAAALGSPSGAAPANAADTPTVSPSVDPSTVDMNKFQPWYANAAKVLGLHPNWQHPDMNKNILDLYTAGAQPVATAPGQPDVFKTPDGKTTPVTPNAFPMVKTSEQLDQERNPALTAVPAPAPIAPTSPTPVSAAIAPTPQPVVAGYAPDMGREVAPPVPPSATPVSTMLAGGTPTVPAPAQPTSEATPTNTKQDALMGKIMTAGGLIATAVNPRQFGPAGEMLAKYGAHQTETAKADEAAQAAGYPNAATMAAIEAKAKMALTTAQARLATEGHLPEALSRAALNTAGLPREAAQTLLLGAEARLKNVQTQNAAAMAPVQMNVNGVNVTVDPHTFVSNMQHNQDLGFRYAQLAQQKGLNDAQRTHLNAEAINLLERVPYPGVEGGLPKNIWAQMNIANNKDWETRNRQWMDMSKHVDDTLKSSREMAALTGKPMKLDANTANNLENTAYQFLRNPEWKWKGAAILLQIGRPIPAWANYSAAPTVSGALASPQPAGTATIPSGPTLQQLEAEKARRGGQ